MNTRLISGLSIVVPVAGRLDLLESLLKSLSTSRSRVDFPCEILLIDNSSLAERPQMMSLAERYNAAYHAGSDNLSEKRNQGVQLAQHDVILFLDSDCTVEANLLQQHFQTHNTANTAGCLGMLEFVGRDTFVWKAVERTSVLACFALPKFEGTAPWGPTANISFRRDVLLKIGGFSQDFSRPGGEDVDLGFRIQDLGAEITCNANALAYHTKDTWSSFRQISRRFLTYGNADALLIRKHPQRTTWDLPTPILLGIVISVYFILGAMLSSRLALLTLPVAWCACTLMAHAGLSIVREQRRLTISEWFLQALSLLLLAELDLGRVIGSIRIREFRAIYRRVLFFDYQQVIDWPAAATSATAAIAALFFIMVLATLL